MSGRVASLTEIRAGGKRAVARALSAIETDAGSADLARWWQQFADPQLDALIDAALADSLDLRQAEARLRQARAARAQAV
ncbi:MAG TPA: hypothetical protein PLJ34_08110, partial [Hyphomicrobiales bacterium]|nr:hypothetical protein [Hyphomicrobiales bacterium]